VISFLKKHLEKWNEGWDWRILFADDYSAHKTESVWSLCWKRGYVLIVHGGGATPVAQTPDTDLKEEVRRRYGNQETAVLMEKMRHGQTVPKLAHEECMDLTHSVLCDKSCTGKLRKGIKRLASQLTSTAKRTT
jgi:hypothetical protein